MDTFNDSESFQLNQLAALLATSFDANLEQGIVEQNKPLADIEFMFPSYVERLEERTVYDLAETPAAKDFVTMNGIPMSRPLTYVEIVEKLHSLGLLKLENIQSSDPQDS